MTNKNVEKMTMAGLIVVAPVLEAALMINKTVKTRMVNLLLKTIRIRITMRRNEDNHNLAHVPQVKTVTFMSTPMKNTSIIQVLPIASTILIPICQPQCMVMNPTVCPNWSACVKSSTHPDTHLLTPDVNNGNSMIIIA